jgi:hypothetical protein
MFGTFFNTADVDKYADWVLGELKRALPLVMEPGAKKIAQRVQKLDGLISSRTIQFTREVRLNIYKKAHLAARLREGMTAHGYPEPFVKSFSYDLLTRIQNASIQKSG